MGAPNNSNNGSDNNIDNEPRSSESSIITIDKNNSLCQQIMEQCKCQCNSRIDNGINCILSSKRVLFLCLVSWTIILCIEVGSESLNLYTFANNPWERCLCYVITTILELVINLSFNYTIVKHILKTFTFWWKIQDTIVFIVIQAIYTYKAHWYSDSYTVILMLLLFFRVCSYVFMIANISALIIVNSNKFIKLFIINGLIVIAIAFNLWVAWYWFTVQTSYPIILCDTNGLMNSACILDTATIMIEKKIDLAVFFMLQLYSNIVHGIDGIAVTGVVAVKWKTHTSKPHNVIPDDSTTNVELQAQLI